MHVSIRVTARICKLFRLTSSRVKEIHESRIIEYREQD